MSRWEKMGAWIFGLFLFGGLFFLIYTSIYHRPVYDDAEYIEGEEDLEEYEDEEEDAEEATEAPATAPAPNAAGERTAPVPTATPAKKKK